MFVSLKKRTVISIILVVIIFALSTSVLTVSGATSVYYNGEPRKVPIYNVDRDDNKISISFDCAYGADYTYKLLDVLDEYKVKCTFFVVEFWVTKYSDVLKEIVKRGHEVGTHSKTHPHMSKLSKSEILNELNSSINAIKSVTGSNVELFRAPYGEYNNKVLSVAEELGLYTIQWDVDSIDWKDISAKQITERVVSRTKSGSIILCHNNALHTHEALPYVLSNLKEKGFTFVPISQLIYKKNYYVDPFGIQKQSVN